MRKVKRTVGYDDEDSDVEGTRSDIKRMRVDNDSDWSLAFVDALLSMNLNDYHMCSMIMMSYLGYSWVYQI